MSHYEKLVAHFTRLSHFHHLQAICGWDQAAMMPEGGNDARSAAMAELAVLCHKQLTEPSLKTMFEGARKESLNEFEQASLTEMERRWQQATVLPEKLVQQKSLAGSRCEHAWRTQRKNNDWEGFKENLKPVVELARQEALIRGAASGLSPYNAMLDLYEPGMTKEKLDPIFSDIKSWLPGIIDQIIEKQEQNQAVPLQGPFSEEKQNQLGLKIMEILGFDFNHGRLDVSTHLSVAASRVMFVSPLAIPMMISPHPLWASSMKPATPAMSRAYLNNTHHCLSAKRVQWVFTKARACFLKCNFLAARHLFLC